MRVERSFAFVDLCGFTRFTDAHGDEQAVAVLTRFRAAVARDRLRPRRAGREVAR